MEGTAWGGWERDWGSAGALGVHSASCGITKMGTAVAEIPCLEVDPAVPPARDNLGQASGGLVFPQHSNSRPCSECRLGTFECIIECDLGVT